MFTGIIEATAEVLSHKGGVLKVRRPGVFRDLKGGSSVCVSGACLTVTALTGKAMAFDVVPETLKRTTLGGKKTGEAVNLERAMRADGRFEGHVVQGHVEGVGEVIACHTERSRSVTCSDKRAWFDGAHHDTFVHVIRPPSHLYPFIIPKGSITIDGVSLTVVGVTNGSFSVALIPTTLHMTTLGDLRKGDRVNIETDILGRTVHQFLSRNHAAIRSR